ncbi:MAG: hypothetical protein JW741_22690 [Sedimentisphaerales bacterium]|nr:hypothetical protein [Sedimentisphaerales bacterium]
MRRSVLPGGVDGDDVSYRWFVYPEAGTYGRSVAVERYATPKARLVVPKVDAPRTVHVILEVCDDGEPPLYSYRRLILEIEP